MSCRDCVNRREFFAIAGVGAGLLVVGCKEGPTIPISTHITVTIANFPGLATVNNLVQVGSSHVAKRLDADSFEAYSMFCTHQGCATSLNSAQQKLLCPCHGSVFNSDGSVSNGPATDPLAKLPTSSDPSTDTLTIN